MTYTTSEEMGLTIRIDANSRFDVTVAGKKMQVDRLLAEFEDGRLMEITAHGTVYKQDGRLGVQRMQVSICPEGGGDLSLGYDLHWDAIPTVYCNVIREWGKERGQQT